MKFDIKNGVKGLIFDLDGTLVDSMPYHFLCWKKACDRFGVKMDPSFLRNQSGIPGWEIASTIIKTTGLNGNVSIDEIMNVKLEEFYKIQDQIKPIEPVVDIVRKYYGKLPMAVGTGGHREAVERILSATGLKKYFDIVVTANDVNKFKPHPETFLRCAEMMDIESRFIEVFEDGVFGMEAARKAGMKVTDVRRWYNSNW